MTPRQRDSLKLVLLLGGVSLFADMTYESARSLHGPYLNLLGAGAFTIGVVAGMGELIGYGLRVLTGLWSDHSRRYWTFTLIGYSVNLIAVPLLALAGNWQAAAGLIMMERIGKAIRSPAKDALLSQAASPLGRGWGFGLHEAMDQIGATLGPLILGFVLLWQQDYPLAFALLGLPAVLALLLLVAARLHYPRPEVFEPEPRQLLPQGFSSLYWLYLTGVCLMAFGFADYPLIGFHAKETGLLSDPWIPWAYAFAMAVDAGAALVFGHWYDRKGVPVLLIAVIASALCAPLLFLGGRFSLFVGLALWGVGMGAMETIIRALVADLVPADRRATGFGIFHAGLGFAWFAGSALMGWLYEVSLPALVLFGLLAQLGAVPLFYRVHRGLRQAQANSA